MNAMSSTLMTLQASDAAAVVVGPGLPAEGSAAVAALPALAAQTPLPHGFAQALAAQLPGMGESVPCVPPAAGERPALPAAPDMARLGPEATALLETCVPAVGEASSEVDAALLDPSGQSALAALLLWPAALPAALPGAAAQAAAPAAAIEAECGAPVAAPSLALDAQWLTQRSADTALAGNSAQLAAPRVTAGQTGFALPTAQPESAPVPNGPVIAAVAAVDLEHSALDSGAAAALPEGLSAWALPAGATRSGAASPSSAAAFGSADAGLTLKGEPRQWQQPLMQALGDRLQLQIAGRSEQAVIRLSPPLLGQVEIAIRQQAGELQVRLSASHGEVRHQLQQVSESLRHELVQRHSGEVTVQVSASSRDGDSRAGAGRESQAQQQQQQHSQQDPQRQDESASQRRPGRALQESSKSGGGPFAVDMEQLASSV